MPAEDKVKILKFLTENPNSSAKTIRDAVGLPPKAHSAALFSMKNTGLIVEHAQVGTKYPLYEVNPDADPAELENPRLIFKRSRGHHRDNRIGSAEQVVLAVLSGDEYRTLDTVMASLGAKGCEFKRAYVTKLINRLEEVEYLDRAGVGDATSWCKTARVLDKERRMKTGE